MALNLALAITIPSAILTHSILGIFLLVSIPIGFSLSTIPPHLIAQVNGLYQISFGAIGINLALFAFLVAIGLGVLKLMIRFNKYLRS
jgi:hypothetical protein